MVFVDLEKLFSEHIKEIVSKNPQKYPNIHSVEKDLYKIYTDWCRMPSEKLDKITPVEYVVALDDDGEIYEYIKHLIENEMEISDIVTDRVIEKSESIEFFENLFETQGKNIQIYATNILNEIGGEKVTDFYIEQLANKNLDKDVENEIYEFLSYDNEYAVDKILKEMYSVDSDKQKLFVEILVNYKDNESIYMWLVSMFYRGEDIPLFANLLGKYGNPKAIDILKSMAVEKNINYLEFMEIRNAVETLGGEWEYTKDFSEDEYYKKIVKREND